MPNVSFEKRWKVSCRTCKQSRVNPEYYPFERPLVTEILATSYMKAQELAVEHVLVTVENYGMVNYNHLVEIEEITIICTNL